MNIPIKAVKAVIINSKREILLLRRNLKIRERSSWDLPGGLIEKNEDEKNALKREVMEELGVEIKVIKVGKTWNFFRSLDEKWVSVQNYSCKIINGTIFLSDEHIAYKWVNKKEVRKYPVKDKSFFNAIE